MKLRSLLLVMLVVVPLSLAGASDEENVPAGLDASAMAIAQKVVSFRHDLHRHPELPNREFRTGKVLAERLRALGLDVRHPVATTGVVAILRGGRDGRVIALRAAMDAVPIQEARLSSHRSLTPGVMHACGHDAQVAVLLGAAEVLASQRQLLPGTIMFVFQPSEEGPPRGEDGGAQLMLKQGVFSSTTPEAIVAFHVDPALDTGKAGWTDGALFASGDRFEVEIRTREALKSETAGALFHDPPDALLAAADVIRAVRSLTQHPADLAATATARVGVAHGGAAFNLVADRVQLEGVLRALDPAARTQLRTALEERVRQATAQHNVSARAAIVGRGTAATTNDPQLARFLQSSLLTVYGADNLSRSAPQMTTEDFSAFAESTPAFYFLVGVRNQASGFDHLTHSPHFDVDDDALPLCLRAIVRISWDLLSQSNPTTRRPPSRN